MSHYHERRSVQVLALAVGTIAVAITAANLVGKALAGGTFGLAEATTLGFLACTVGVGILAKLMAAQRRYGYAAIFYATFAVGTVLVVYTSVGGQHGAAAQAESDAVNANKALADLGDEKRRIDSRIDALRRELAPYAGVPSSVEVKGRLDAVVGNGPDKVPVAVWRRTKNCAATEISKNGSDVGCKPALDLRELNGRALAKERLQRDLAAEDAKRGAIVARIAASGGEKPVPVQARGFAEFAGLLGFSAKRVEFVMSRLDKVLVAFFLELVGVFALEYGLAGLFLARASCSSARATPLAGSRPPAPVNSPTFSDSSPDGLVATAQRTDGPVRKQASGRSGGGGQSVAGGRRAAGVSPATREECEADLLTLLALGQSVPSQRTLAERWGRPKQTVSDWLTTWEADGLIPSRRQVGREKMIHGAGGRLAAGESPAPTNKARAVA